jgi:hypothetical protein
MKKIASFIILFLSPYFCFAQTTAELLCKDVDSYMQFPNGNKKDVFMEGGKPYVVSAKGNVMASYYPNGPVTVADGARFSKTQEAKLKNGDRLIENHYESNKNGIQGRFTIIRNLTKNKTYFMMQTIISGTLQVNTANCDSK